VLDETVLDQVFLGGQQLMIVSFDSWKKLVDSKSLWLSDIPSTLILKESN